MDLTEDELKPLYKWIDQIPLSRPKRNIARDFADGVLVAEVCHHYFPRLVDLHNYPPANSMQQKLYNWDTLNSRARLPRPGTARPARSAEATAARPRAARARRPPRRRSCGSSARRCRGTRSRPCASARPGGPDSTAARPSVSRATTFLRSRVS